MAHGSGPLTNVALIAIAVVAVAAPCSHGSDNPSLKEVIRRLTTYVETYGEKASIVVATERYTQTSASDSRSGFSQRAMLADFAIVKAEANHTWIGFRDVIEVDGDPVPDRENRLIDVLTSSSGSMEEARRISDESARFNIGGMLRNFNVPTTVLFFFSRENVDRFRFSRKAQMEDGSWEIHFREVYKPTMIRTPEGGSVPSEGTIWVRPVDGTVLRTHLRVTTLDDSLRGVAEIDVTFQRVETLSMWLPATMDESYLAMRLPRTHTTGHAEYSNYRRFETSVRIR
jgi:hypothetical protein